MENNYLWIKNPTDERLYNLKDCIRIVPHFKGDRTYRSYVYLHYMKNSVEIYFDNDEEVKNFMSLIEDLIKPLEINYKQINKL